MDITFNKSEGNVVQLSFVKNVQLKNVLFVKNNSNYQTINPNVHLAMSFL